MSRLLYGLLSKLCVCQADFIQQNQWCAHEDAIELCRRQNLSQAEYFLHRDLIYMRDVSAFVYY